MGKKKIKVGKLNNHGGKESHIGMGRKVIVAPDFAVASGFNQFISSKIPVI